MIIDCRRDRVVELARVYVTVAPVPRRKGGREIGGHSGEGAGRVGQRHDGGSERRVGW